MTRVDPGRPAKESKDESMETWFPRALTLADDGEVHQSYIQVMVGSQVASFSGQIHIRDSGPRSEDR